MNMPRNYLKRLSTLLQHSGLAHVKSKCDYFCESSHHVGFKSSLAHSLYMSERLLWTRFNPRFKK